MAGYIKLYRQLLENPVVCKDTDHLAVWVYLLANATHTNYDIVYSGQRITLKPGQLVTSRRAISENFKTQLSQSKVQRILKTFEIEQQIEQRTNRQSRLITILKWNEYQQSEQQSEQRVNNEWTTSEQRVNTNKNVKKVKKVKNIPEALREPLNDFIEMRKKIKAPLTDRALDMLLKKLNQLSGGSTEKSIEILNQSTMNGWKGIFPLKENKNQNPFLRILEERKYEQ